MPTPWLILTSRYGADTRNPTPAQLAAAIAELYHETLPATAFSLLPVPPIAIAFCSLPATGEG
jgi:hypothetical protein